MIENIKAVLDRAQTALKRWERVVHAIGALTRFAFDLAQRLGLL